MAKGKAEEARRLLVRLGTRRFGPYSVQAAIATIHATAPTAAATDWPQIVALYDTLLAMSPSPVVEKSDRMMWPDCSPPTLKPPLAISSST